MPHPRLHGSFTVLTGATGLIGHQVLARLLRSGRRVIAMQRRGADDLPRLRTLLAPLGVDPGEHLQRGSLLLLRGDVCDSIDALPPVAAGRVDGAIHAAACTRFQEDDDGNPHRTNVAGTARLLEWATAHDVRTLHLVSTAYVCGRSSTQGRAARRLPVRECVEAAPPVFHNAYERSKWRCEQMCAAWARGHAGRGLTILRPSIVVGEFATGRTPRFTGFYLAVRAAEAVSGLLQARVRRGQRPATVLRLRGRALGRQNIVPVDYVASMIAAIACDREHHPRGLRTYHLVHPSPPSNRLIQQALQAHFHLGCTRFVGDQAGPARRNALERAFDRLARSVEPYIADTPEFQRHNAAQVERAAGIACPRFDSAALRRLCAFATGSGWRDAGAQAGQACEPAMADPSAYFERFLPQRLPLSRVAHMHRVSATVRFVLSDVPDGQWVCRFVSGRLAQVRRGGGERRPADFGYRTTHAVFTQAIAGRLDPQQAFLSRQAEVFGNIERGLKMAMVLREFNREFPFHAGAGAPRGNTLEAACA